MLPAVPLPNLPVASAVADGDQLLLVQGGAARLATRAQVAAGPNPSGAGYQCYNVQAYGASGQGTDDTAAIQAAIQAAYATNGVVYLPRGRYLISDTLHFGDGQGRSINLVGDGRNSTYLVWTGPTDGRPAIQVDAVSGYVFEGFDLSYPPGTNGARGQSVGVWVRASSGGGTRSAGAQWRHLSVGGFGVGARLGELVVSRSASEYVFDHCRFSLNDTGCEFQDWNTLDHLFLMPELGANGYGVSAPNGSLVTVVGGSASYSTRADFFLSPGGANTITGFRSEGSACVTFCNSTTANTTLLIQGGYFHPASDGGVLIAGNLGCNLTVVGATVLGGITFSSVSGGRVNLLGNSIYAPQPLSAPNNVLPYLSLGNKRIDGSNTFVAHFPDEVGLTRADGTLAPTLRLTADGKASFFGAAGSVQAVLAAGAGHTVDDVIAVLQSFGLARQS